MFSFLHNFSYCKHLGYIAALSLGLGSCAQQQAKPVSTAPLPQMQAARYYLNAKPSTKEVIEQLAPQTITRVETLDGPRAGDYAHDPSVKQAIVVQTK